MHKSCYSVWHFAVDEPDEPDRRGNTQFTDAAAPRVPTCHLYWDTLSSIPVRNNHIALSKMCEIVEMGRLVGASASFAGASMASSHELAEISPKYQPSASQVPAKSSKILTSRKSPAPQRRQD